MLPPSGMKVVESGFYSSIQDYPGRAAKHAWLGLELAPLPPQLRLRVDMVALGLVEQQLVNLGHVVGAADVLAHADARELGHGVGEGGDREDAPGDS